MKADLCLDDLTRSDFNEYLSILERVTLKKNMIQRDAELSQSYSNSDLAEVDNETQRPSEVFVMSSGA